MRVVGSLLALSMFTLPLAAQAPERSIRRTIPITRGFERALEAGSRDSSGTPTARYWQLKTDYTISAKLDPATSTVTGTERITLTNPSADTLTSVALRLYQNLFAPNVARSSPVAALTSGDVHDYARATFYTGLAAWAFMEAEDGDNWFRRVIGVVGLVYVIVKIAEALGA